jgi:ABC-2 type transport system permease protein
MKRVWLVIQHEFMSNIRKRSFLWATFGAPIFSIALIAFIIWITVVSAEQGSVAGEAVGYIDEAGLLTDAAELPETFQAYPDATAARAALVAQTIDSYFIIPENYLATGEVALYAYGGIPESLQDAVEDVLTRQLVHEIAPEIAPERLIRPANISIFMENTQRALGRETAAILGIFLVPLLFVVVFMIALSMTSSLLMTSVVEEKGNRIMEILLTSVRPMELLTGKLIGLGALGLVQIGVWLVVAAVGLTLGRNTDLLQGVVVPPDMLVLALVYFVMSYFLYASLFAGIGAVTGGEQEARQYAGLVSFFSSLPMVLLFFFLSDPNGAVPTILSIFPFTAGISMVLRASFVTVPPEQIALSVGVMAATTIFVIWASTRVFRWALLMYGKRITVRELWRVIRSDVEMGTTTAASAKES